MSEDLELENKIKELIEQGKTRKHIKELLNIPYCRFDKIKNKLLQENRINIEKVVEKQTPKKKEKTNNKEINFKSPETKAKYDIIDILSRRYLNYNETKKFNTYLTKKIETMHYQYSYEDILYTIKKCESRMDYAAMNKKFDNDVQKIAYLCAIINNNIQVGSSKVQTEPKESTDPAYIKKKLYDIMEIKKTYISKPSGRRDMTDLIDD